MDKQYLLIIALLASVTALVAGVLLLSLFQKGIILKSPALRSTLPVSAIPNQLLVYADPQYNFSFSYPKNWVITAANSGSGRIITVTNPDEFTLKLFYNAKMPLNAVPTVYYAEKQLSVAGIGFIEGYINDCHYNTQFPEPACRDYLSRIVFSDDIQGTVSAKKIGPFNMNGKPVFIVADMMHPVKIADVRNISQIDTQINTVISSFKVSLFSLL